MISILLVLSISSLSQSITLPNKTHICCEGINIVHNSTCANGKQNDLQCKSSTILNPNMDHSEDFNVNEDGDLVVTFELFQEDVIINHNEYCIAKLRTEDSKHVAVVCFPDTPEEKFYSLRAICMIVSVVFLVATLTVYCLVPSLRDLQGKCIMHNIAALAVAMLTLSLMQLFVFDEHPCTFIGFFAYFVFLTAFFWLNVTSFQIWKTVVHPDIAGTDKQWYLGYLAYGHGMPLLFLFFVLLAHHVPGSHLKPRFGERSCWFPGMAETWAYFYGPIAILLILNLIMFIWCISKLWNERKTDLRTNSLKYKVRLYTKLFLLMGIMWMFELISSIFEGAHVMLDYVWILTDYINVLQGAFIFFLLVVCRKRALRGLSERRCCCITFPSTWKNLLDEEESQAADTVEPVTVINEYA